jgi:ATP-dependent Clp protease ATP-binding subunit ClpA
MRQLDGGEGLYLGEVLGFAELLALHAKPERLRGVLKGLAKQILAESPALEVHRRLGAAGGQPGVSKVVVPLAPAKASAAWSEPITLRFDVLRWRHGEEASIAYVPALGIEVVAARDELLDELIPKHIRMALARTKASERLFELVQLARGESVEVEAETVWANVRTPAQVLAEGAKAEEPAKPVIEEAGTVLSEQNTARAYEIDEVVDELAEALAGANPRSVLLVGPSGVGKTAAFGELFWQRRQHRLGGAVFWATSGARLIAGMSGYGLWQQRCQRLCREAKREGAVLHLGNLVELMEVGKVGGGGVGIANFFRPYLARGEVLAVAECTPEQLPMIERANPHLLQVFQMIGVEEMGAERVAAILRRAAEVLAEGGAARVTSEAVGVIERLHRRYATYSAAPGRPLRFLRNLVRDRGPGEAIDGTAVTAAFARETGLPMFLIDDGTPLDLAAARAQFGARVIGQAEAVGLVSDLLATVKAGLNRPRRPIASLLFIGPTGVGKTEMAKAIVEYFFGDRTGGRLVRFDMSEFATAGAVARLVGSAWESEGLLTGRVREQPFCVVLLDEFEKAHPAFFDLLLQVLGEGRLTDAAGRLADFSNAIVVMTSNLGAETFGAGPFGLARATTSDTAHAKGHFTDAVRAFLRPEMFNRIDRVVPFLPLSEETIGRIAAREIELVRGRDGIARRNVALEATAGAVAHLARAGYDPLYGARPLRRRIERDLLAPLADAVNQYSPATPLEVVVDVREGRLVIDVRAARAEAVNRRAGESGKGMVAGSPGLGIAGASASRRRAQGLRRCPAALALANELFSLERLVARKEAHPGRRYVDPAQRERLRRLRTIAEGLDELGAGATALEDALLLSIYEGTAPPLDGPGIEGRMRDLQERAEELLLRLFTLDQADPDSVTVALYGSAASDVFALARAYREVARLKSGAVGVWYFTRMGKNQVQRHTVDAEEAEAFLANPRGVLGLLLAVRAPFARALFEPEAGLHVVEEERNKNPHAVLVETSALGAAEYRPPKDVEFRVALVGQRRRTYTLDRQEANDGATGRVYRWPPRGMWQGLVMAMEEHLRRRAEGILGE